MRPEEEYAKWMEDPYFDWKTKEELRAIEGNNEEIQERFYKELEFGTAGLRGIIGAGTNRINRYTIQKATQGLANYIKMKGKEAKGVVIAYDSRRKSVEFAKEAALCLAGNGIKAYLFGELRPTPELSFGVRYLQAAAGINITASHNPPEYNGYKVYWEDGAQITPPHDAGIMDEVKKISEFSQVHCMEEKAAREKGLLEIIGGKIDEKYIEEVGKLVLHPEIIKKVQNELAIVYTPLHGTGNMPVRRVLQEAGFENVYVVKEQEKPDGEFPTVEVPNPEVEEAFCLGIELAEKVDADLIIATDPDADRLGVYVRDRKTNRYRPFTGNMSGCLIGDYLIGQKSLKGPLPEDGVFIKSIVTTNMADAIARHYGIRLIQVLTGFKYIGQKMLEFEQQGTGTYLFGMEESYGCLPGAYARDKDAVAAALVLCEAAAYYKNQGKTLWDGMLTLYEAYGYYLEDVRSVTLTGRDGLEKIQRIMEGLRKNPPEQFGKYPVVSIRDYENNVITNLKMGNITDTGLPRSNVLYYELAEEAWVCIRPSGTEPKIKIYYGVRERSLSDADRCLEELGESASQMV